MLDREDNSNPKAFIIGSGVRHRYSKKKSIEGSFVKRNKGQKGKKKAYRNFHVGLGRQLQEQNVLWLMMRMMICPMNAHHCMAKSHLLKTTLKWFYFLAWV